MDDLVISLNVQRDGQTVAIGESTIHDNGDGTYSIATTLNPGEENNIACINSVGPSSPFLGAPLQATNYNPTA